MTINIRPSYLLNILTNEPNKKKKFVFHLLLNIVCSTFIFYTNIKYRMHQIFLTYINLMCIYYYPQENIIRFACRSYILSNFRWMSFQLIYLEIWLSVEDKIHIKMHFTLNQIYIFSIRSFRNRKVFKDSTRRMFEILGL